MRLLDTKTGMFREFAELDTMPLYAILSHTWDKNGEQTYQDILDIHKSLASEDNFVASPKTLLPTSPSPSLKEDKSLSYDSSRTGEHDSTSLKGNPKLYRTRRVSASISSETHYGSLPPTTSTSTTLRSSSVHKLHSIWDDPRVSPKIRRACAIALEHGYRYIWIDSCCIDSSSSSELSEAINSMYRWYSRASLCYAYLADVYGSKTYPLLQVTFAESRWFKRGWTLQELIAPREVLFLSSGWEIVGSKDSLAYEVQKITGISRDVLMHKRPLEAVSVAKRMSWAANRETTRIEDQAYALLGIFDINMPTLYGEGSRAFRRLQEEILQRIPDQSLFVWGRTQLEPLPVGEPLIPQLNQPHNSLHFFLGRRRPSSSLFASSPRDFRGSGDIRPVPHEMLLSRVGLPARELPLPEYTKSPYGVRTKFLLLDVLAGLPAKLVEARNPPEAKWYLAILACEHANHVGRLLATVCYAEPSSANLRLLQAGFVATWEPHVDESNQKFSDFVVLSSAHIERVREHLHACTIYIPHPQRTTSSSDMKFRPTGSLDVILPGWSNVVWKEQGYELVSFKRTRDDPVTYRLALSKGGSAIHIEFMYKDMEFDSVKVCTHASTFESSGVPIADRYNTTSSGWRVWRTSTERFEFKELTVARTRGSTVSVHVGLDRSSQFSCHLRVKVVDVASGRQEANDGTDSKMNLEGAGSEFSGPGDEHGLLGGYSDDSEDERDRLRYQARRRWLRLD